MEGKELYKQLDEIQESLTNTVIIDGIDVAGCEHHLSTGYCQLQMIFQGMVLKLPFGKHLECNLCDKDCYYKQLKRLEQENKELKEKIENKPLQCLLYNNKQNKCAIFTKTVAYRIALEEIRKDFNNFRFIIIPFHVGAKEVLPHKLVDVIQDYCIEIENRIYEVLKK